MSTTAQRLAAKDLAKGMIVKRIDRSGMTRRINHYEITWTFGSRRCGYMLNVDGERIGARTDLTDAFMVHYEVIR